MPDNNFIEKLIHISGVATWHDNRPDSPDADFSRKSIVYGFNGTGKTSLSRVFSSLEANCLVDGLGGGTRFQVKFSDGTIATEADFSNPLGNHLLVFNSDFVSRNFSWDEGAASPIFHIDEANIEKMNELRQFETELETALAEAEAANTRQINTEKEFQGKGTEIGARVREFRGTGYTQQFNRRNVDAEYSEREFTKEDVLDDKQIDELRAIIRQPEPRAKINFHFELPEDFRDGLEATCDLLQRDFAAQLTSDLAAHPKMLAWVADGHQYHKDHRLGSV